MLLHHHCGILLLVTIDNAATYWVNIPAAIFICSIRLRSGCSKWSFCWFHHASAWAEQLHLLWGYITSDLLWIMQQLLHSLDFGSNMCHSSNPSTGLTSQYQVQKNVSWCRVCSKSHSLLLTRRGWKQVWLSQKHYVAGRFHFHTCNFNYPRSM